jgi:hypothetical protein
MPRVSRGKAMPIKELALVSNCRALPRRSAESPIGVSWSPLPYIAGEHSWRISLERRLVVLQLLLNHTDMEVCYEKMGESPPRRRRASVQLLVQQSERADWSRSEGVRRIWERASDRVRWCQVEIENPIRLEHP